MGWVMLNFGAGMYWRVVKRGGPGCACCKSTAKLQEENMDSRAWTDDLDSAFGLGEQTVHAGYASRMVAQKSLDRRGTIGCGAVPWPVRIIGRRE